MSQEIDGLTNSQARMFMATGSQDSLPKLELKRDDDDLLNSLSQGRVGSQDPILSEAGLPPSQNSVLNASNMLEAEQLERCRREAEAPVTTMERVYSGDLFDLFESGHQFDHMPLVNMNTVSEMVCTNVSVTSFSGAPHISSAVYSNCAYDRPLKAELSINNDRLLEERVVNVTVPPQKKSKTSKNLDWLTTNNGSGIFCKMGPRVPFELSFPDGVTDVTILAQFDDATYIGKPVERCPNHINKENSSALRKFFIRSDLDDSQVKYSSSEEKYALVIPLNGRPDRHVHNINLEFTCMTSCQGGINRRAIHLVFQFNSGTQKVSELRFPLRVCANPVRDATKEKLVIDGLDLEEYQLDHSKVKSEKSSPMHQQGSSTTPPVPASKFRKRPQKMDMFTSKKPRSEGDGVHTIHVFGDEKYKMLLKTLLPMENTERYASLKSEVNGGCPTLPTNQSQISMDTAVEIWLNEMNLAHHIPCFQNGDIFSLADVHEKFHGKFFEELGIPPQECGDLNRIFLNWRNVYLANNIMLDQD